MTPHFRYSVTERLRSIYITYTIVSFGIIRSHFKNLASSLMAWHDWRENVTSSLHILKNRDDCEWLDTSLSPTTDPAVGRVGLKPPTPAPTHNRWKLYEAPTTVFDIGWRERRKITERGWRREFVTFGAPILRFQFLIMGEGREWRKKRGWRRGFVTFGPNQLHNIVHLVKMENVGRLFQKYLIMCIMREDQLVTINANMKWKLQSTILLWSMIMSDKVFRLHNKIITGMCERAYSLVVIRAPVAPQGFDFLWERISQDLTTFVLSVVGDVLVGSDVPVVTSSISRIYQLDLRRVEFSRVCS
jgi:hypothetical protein